MKRFLASLAAVVVTASLALGATIPLFSGPQEVSQLFSYLNTLIQSINAQTTPQYVATFTNYRNVLDNGDMSLNQRGSATVTCSNSTPTSITYGLDRWGCTTNVTTNAQGRSAVTTSTPTPPTGFTQSNTIWRNSSTAVQPICAMQEIGTVSSTALAGQSVVLSVQEQPLAGLVADNGGAFNTYIFTGTGTDQGFSSFTAAPAITPAWTGIATTGSFSFTNAASAWGTYYGSAVIPAATKEIAVAICFTPTATGAGATDGLAFVAFQLEQSSSGLPSSYEHKQPGYEMVNALRYYYNITESATSGTQQSAAGNGATTTTCQIYFPFPMLMRAAPTFTSVALTTSTFTITHVATATALASTFANVLGANTPSGGSLTMTVASGLTAGQTCVLTSAAAATPGQLTWSADY
jgi:hypothetical protein